MAFFIYIEFIHKVTIILAGYKDAIEEKLYSFNVGMASRFKTVQFDDFSDDQLLQLWKKECNDGKWLCDDRVSQVAARRIARQKGYFFLILCII